MSKKTTAEQGILGEKIAGDPLGETAVLLAVQGFFADKPQTWDGLLSAARTMSHFGEHALGWMGTAAAGYGLSAAAGQPADGRQRREWLAVGVSAFLAHAASVVIKRIVRRPRPHHAAISIGVETPSKLSFPSSHATSSTAALVAISDMTGSKLPLIGVPAMAFSRLILGVHYPTDVATGTLVGAVTAKVTRKLLVPAASGSSPAPGRGAKQNGPAASAGAPTSPTAGSAHTNPATPATH